MFSPSGFPAPFAARQAVRKTDGDDVEGDGVDFAATESNSKKDEQKRMLTLLKTYYSSTSQLNMMEVIDADAYMKPERVQLNMSHDY